MASLTFDPAAVGRWLRGAFGDQTLPTPTHSPQRRTWGGRLCVEPRFFPGKSQVFFRLGERLEYLSFVDICFNVISLCLSGRSQFMPSEKVKSPGNWIIPFICGHDAAQGSGRVRPPRALPLTSALTLSEVGPGALRCPHRPGGQRRARGHTRTAGRPDSGVFPVRPPVHRPSTLGWADPARPSNLTLQLAMTFPSAVTPRPRPPQWQAGLAPVTVQGAGA